MKVPDNLPDKNLISFYKGWCWPKNPDNSILIDFTDVNHISPWALTQFAAYGLWVKEAKHKNIKIKLNERSSAGAFIARSGLLDLFDQADGAEIDEYLPEKTVPLTRITSSQEILPFTKNVMNILKIEDAEIEGAIKYSLIELLRNVLQHSKSQIGGLAMAEYYPTKELVKLVVADLGIGIQASLQEKYPEIAEDYQALKFATQPHISGTFNYGAYQSMGDNAGLGLFFIKQIASLAGGCLYLGSYDCLFDIWNTRDDNHGKKIFSVTKDEAGWPGTFAMMHLNKGRVADFDAILRTCRKISDEARNNPIEMSLDFIDEVPEISNKEWVRVEDFEEDVETAGIIRESSIRPALAEGRFVVLDFENVPFATQSFIHALMYKIFRDYPNVTNSLFFANCPHSTQEAIQIVASYAAVEEKGGLPNNWQI